MAFSDEKQEEPKIESSLGYDDSKEPLLPHMSKASMLSKGLLFAILLAGIAGYIALTNIEFNSDGSSYEAQLTELEEKTGALPIE